MIKALSTSIPISSSFTIHYGNGTLGSAGNRRTSTLLRQEPAVRIDNKGRRLGMVASASGVGVSYLCRSCSKSTVLSSFAALLLVYATSVLLWRPRHSDIVWTDAKGIDGFQGRAEGWAELTSAGDHVQRAPFPALVEKLLSDLREATRVAEEGSGGVAYTKDEREKWRAENPCRARSELPHLLGQKLARNAVRRNYQWEAVLEEYSALHRTCVRKVRDLGEYFDKEGSVPTCKFVTGESLFGLGNRITHAASVLLYGILTQRVVLLYEWTTWVPAVMCEPFEGSSWRLPQSLEYLNERARSPLNVNEETITNVTMSFLDWVDRQKAKGEEGRGQQSEKQYYAEMDDGWQPVDRFFCDSEQKLLSQVRFLSMAGCLYFLPKLFAVPAFRSTLEALFPDRMALTHVLRSAFLPYNVAWDRIRRAHDLFLREADKRVGVQVRYRHGAYEHSRLRGAVNRRTLRCLVENGILQNVSDSRVLDARNAKYAAGLRSAGERNRIVKVVVTSMYSDLQEELQDLYMRHPTVAGESVGFVQLMHESDQRWGMEPDTQALVEIVLLALTDELLVTPLSTFGGVAQAYGGLRPWIVEHGEPDDDDRKPCVRASSVDLCYQRGTDRFSCPHDPRVHGQKISEYVPRIENCLPIDSDSGLVLITD